MTTALDKKIVLLVGPKGAGKSHIGTALSGMFKASFLRIEKIWQDMSPDHMDFDSPSFMAEGIRRSLEAVFDRLSENNVVILESSGAFDLFPSYLVSLQAIGNICLVNVRAPLDQCLMRIKARDQSLHVPVPDAVIQELNKRSSNVSMNWDVVIVNDPFISRDELKEKFLPFLELRN